MSEIKKDAAQINWNWWYFYEENDYGRGSESFIDQKSLLKTLQIYFKDILSQDLTKKNKRKLWNKKIGHWIIYPRESNIKKRLLVTNFV